MRVHVLTCVCCGGQVAILPELQLCLTLIDRNLAAWGAQIAAATPPPGQ
jgi:hypothetical protein